MDPRPERHEAFLRIASIVGERSTCPRADVGALITSSGRIIGMGYNGAPPGMDHCTEVGCEDEVLTFNPIAPHLKKTELAGRVEGCTRTVHAEANAIAFAARDGVAIDGSTMYCTHAPCYTCAKLIISAGVRVLHFITPYRDTRGVLLLDNAQVLVSRHAV